MNLFIALDSSFVVDFVEDRVLLRVSFLLSLFDFLLVSWVLVVYFLHNLGALFAFLFLIYVLFIYNEKEKKKGGGGWGLMWCQNMALKVETPKSTSFILVTTTRIMRSSHLFPYIIKHPYALLSS